MAPRERWAFLKEKSPGFHHWLTRDDKPYPLVREVTFGAVAILLLVALLWGLTGQRLGDAPVVVVESGSMMHCSNGMQPLGRNCDSDRYGRLGTIDPGDLVFVVDVDKPSDVGTLAGADDGRYGRAGDVIVYRPGGSERSTPIIHRAIFWLEINEDRTFSIPQLGLSNIADLDRPEIQALGLKSGYGQELLHTGAGPALSGFITKGDNNPQADQGTLTPLPVQMDWVLGKARGEVPWIGLVKLKLTDVLRGTSNYSNAPGDSRLLMWVTLVVLLAGPWVTEKAVKQYHLRKGGDDGAPPKNDGPEIDR